MAGPCTPNIFGIDGPVISASKIPTLYPAFAIIDASEDVTKDLPTPPLPLTIPITCLIRAFGFVSTSNGFFLFADAQPAQLSFEQVDALAHPFFSSAIILISSLLYAFLLIIHNCF